MEKNTSYLERQILEEYSKTTRTSKKRYDRALRVIPSGTHRGVIFYKPYPVYCRSAKGSRIWDVDGTERIDYCFNYSSIILGHLNTRVISRIRQELECGLGRGQPTVYEVDLAEKVAKLVPAAEKVKFTVTGTEACMNAIRAARAFTRKNKVIMFEGAYHGSSDSVSVDGLAFQSQGIPPDVQKQVMILPFNKPEILEREIRNNRDQVAAVLLEPILAAGGTIIPSPDFSKRVREITEKFGIVMIMDEIVTGFRIARGGWQEKYKVQPDLATLGKNITGGMPGGAVVGTAEIMDDVYAYPEHAGSPKTPLSGTFNAHPISMVAGLATLEQLTSDLFERIGVTSSNLRRGFVKICADLKIAGQAPGIDSIFQYYFSEKEIKTFKIASSANKMLRWYLDIALLNSGVYLAPGHFCCTSYATTNKDVKQTLNAIERVLSSYAPLFRMGN
ncbi:MAG: aspartate aminotransferase family protein [Thaumarchaeota archaeon]|nr:aspartate aminotransferase family protein [Nitrososphaerota archaeon]MCL5067405.1 aspartate aminotransferase family protein [Nitrososphaerota archaeon]